MGSPAPAPAAKAAADPTSALLREVLGDEVTKRFEEDLELAPRPKTSGGDISSGGLMSKVVGFAKLLASSDKTALETRMRRMLEALRAMQTERHASPFTEPDSPFRRAAQKLSEQGHRYIIFGHTHFARNVPLEGGATYLNSGTWADRILFPDEVIEGDDDAALAKVAEFADDMKVGRFDRWVNYWPTYIRLEEEGGKIRAAQLCEYTGDALDSPERWVTKGD